MDESKEARERTLKFLSTPMVEWKDIPPGDGARLIPSMTLVVKLTTKEWEAPEYHKNCFVPPLTLEAMGHSQLLGVVIKTDQTRDGVLPGGLLLIAPQEEVEHVLWHGPRTPT
jgi:hypothetical protein